MRIEVRPFIVALFFGVLTGWCPVVSLADSSDITADFGYRVLLEQRQSGSLSLTVDLGGTSGEFLLDTGASMVTISRGLFESVRALGGAEPAGEVAARLASGRLEILEVYEIETFRLGNTCELGPLKVAVMPRGGRNLLGMSALSRAAPFTVSTVPPALGLSGCASQSIAAR